MLKGLLSFCYGLVKAKTLSLLSYHELSVRGRLLQKKLHASRGAVWLPLEV